MTEEVVGYGYCPKCGHSCNVLIDKWERESVPLRTGRYTECCGMMPVYQIDDVPDLEDCEHIGNVRLVRKRNKRVLDAEAFGQEKED